MKVIVSEQFAISLGNSAGTLDEDANINHFFESCKLFSKYFSKKIMKGKRQPEIIIIKTVSK